MEGKIVDRDLGYDDFDLPLYDDSMNDSGNEGSNYDDDKDEYGTESSIRVHNSYDDYGVHTPIIKTILFFMHDDEGGDGKNNVEEGESLVRQKKDWGSVASVALTVVLFGVEGSNGDKFIKRSWSFDPDTFQYFAHILEIDHPSSCIRQLNATTRS